MSLGIKRRKLLKKEFTSLGILIMLGLVVLIILSRTVGCSTNTFSSCTAVSGFDELMLVLASTVYVLTIIVMPLLILITIIYALIVLRKLEK
jgi:hypothetical protein